MSELLNKYPKPRILHLLEISLPKLSGYTIRTHNILQQQKEYYYPLALINPKRDRNEKPYILDKIIYYRFFPYPLYNLISKSRVLKILKISQGYKKIYHLFFENIKKKLSKFVKSQKIILIHAHSPSHFPKYGYKVAKELKIPFIYEVRGFIEETKVGLGIWRRDSRKYQKKQKEEIKLMKKADAIITLGKAMKRYIEFRSIENNKIHIVPNGVNIKDFNPLPPDKELKKKLNLNQKKIIGFIGSIRKIEGIEILLEAFYFLKKTTKNVKLLIVGPVRPDDYLKSLKLYIETLKIKNDVIFTGKVPHEEIKRFYSIIDIFVLPRLNIRVNRLVTPLKPLEVMAMGKVLLASDLPALKELIIPNISGDLFEAENAKALGIKIEEYLKNTDKANKLKQTAREYVVNNYSWFEIIKKYNFIYEKLIN